MDTSVGKLFLSEEVAKTRSKVSAKNKKELTGMPSSLSRNQVLGVKNEDILHVGYENSESPQGKGELEVPLNVFGAGIKRRRNGSKALRVKPNVPGSNSDKVEGLRGHNGSTWTENSESNTESSVLKEKKYNCLGDCAENRTPEKGNNRDLQKTDSTSSSGATSSHLSGQKRKERAKASKEVEEENIEQNAARLLCALSGQRSDLISGQRSGLNVSKSVNGVEILSDVQESSGLVESCRVLGPRRREGFARKRRHFYEVNLRDFNPFSIVKWRIRVYWPLDHSWYIGSVKEYDPVIRQHCVKYDDQEEEWLDLHHERFKLLLFPSDVPNKSKRNENKNPNLLAGENIKEEREDDSDASIDKIVETKPVKSMLSCSSFQQKSNSTPLISDSHNLEIKANKSPVRNDKFVVVYTRKRFRNRRENVNSMSILASVAETALADATRVLPSHGGVVLKLNLPLDMFAVQVLIAMHFWHWHSLFLLYHGTLIVMSPLVKLQIMVLNNSSGWRYFLFEVCLRSAVSLFCFLVEVFNVGNECNGNESKMPVTSITYTISGLHGSKGRTVICLFSFFQITNLRWANLLKRLKCEYSSIEMEDSSSGLGDPLLVFQPIFSGVNPMIFFMNEKSTSKLPSSVLGSHNGMMPICSSRQNLDRTTLACVSGDDKNKECSATNSTNIDGNDTMVLSPPTTSVVKVPVDQISYVVALPAPVQRTNALIHSSTPTARRSTLHRARPSSFPKLWSSIDSVISRKPRSATTNQPWLMEPGSKSQPNHQKVQHSSKFSRSKSSGNALTCYANVLVTADNKGWRESGAYIVLDSDEQECARLCVQFSRETKYFYCANQVMQPGSTNRYTHAMMWRGGRDWSLEFPDRNQWFIFKEMYEDCYNQNMRAASIKNIPTPGVRMVDGENMFGFRQPFVRGSRYIRRIGSDIDVALDPSRVIYDMDSEDEEWILGFTGEKELTEDLFELVMDKCEKLAYMKQCTEFTTEQIEELLGDVGPMDVVKEVACYWSTKRQKKKMPLIRHLQPPLWMHYQKQLDEWESSVRKILRAPHSALSKAPPAEKPPMFAFCLKPRDTQLKRPQKKLLLSSQSIGGSQKSGRRISTPSRQKVGSLSRLNHLSRTRVSESQFSENRQAGSSLSHNKTVLRGKHVRPSSSDTPDRTNLGSLHSENHWFLKEHAEEFKLRDAQSAAQHAANMAKLKKEKAQLLMEKADLAMYKARRALMIADVINSSKG